MQFSQLAGFLGTALAVIAYFPQIVHLIKEHCSAGISYEAYLLWCLSGILLLMHALVIHDNVFIVLQAGNTVAAFLILGYTTRYQRGVCRSHRFLDRGPNDPIH